MLLSHHVIWVVLVCCITSAIFVFHKSWINFGLGAVHVLNPATSLIQFYYIFKDFSMDCGICYAYRLDGAIPDQVCDDSHCGQTFHQVCLYEV